MSIKVLVFDDNPQRRDALATLIDCTEGMECMATYEDCRDVIARVTLHKPDVVLMDINMPYVDGIAGVAAIKKEFPQILVLMQTVFEDDDKVFASICAGADGYILKQSKPEQLINAIQDVLSGGAPMTPVIARKVLQLFARQHNQEPTQSFDLTKRELEILELLVKGYTYKMIAETCFISYPTVNTHVSNIYHKLQVESAASAVALAIKQGLVN